MDEAAGVDDPPESQIRVISDASSVRLPFRDGEAIAEAVQRPTMKFIATKTAEQLDLQALHRVRERRSATALA